MISPFVEYGNPLERFFALLVDWLLLILLLVPLLYAQLGPDYWLILSGELSTAEVWAQLGWQYILVSDVLPVLITILFWLQFNATPGKMLFDCQIVDANTGQTISFLQALVRVLGYIISALPLGLGFLWAIWDSRHQTWHDKLAGTVVIMHDEATKSLQQLERECR